MGTQGRAGDRLRQRLRDERERRGLSQRAIANLFAPNGLIIHASTVNKIEAGDRAVTVDELDVYATIFAMSTDALIGRSTGDLAWVVSNLTSNAQRAAGEVARLRERLRDEYEDVRSAVLNPSAERPADLLEHIGTALLKLGEAQEWLTRLANQFPLPMG